jgi:hypothetical protein
MKHHILFPWNVDRTMMTKGQRRAEFHTLQSFAKLKAIKVYMLSSSSSPIVSSNRAYCNQTSEFSPSSALPTILQNGKEKTTN